MIIQGLVNQLGGGSEHVFDMDAEPEPMTVDSGAVYRVCHNCVLLIVIIQGVVNQLGGGSEHVFDMDAEPEPMTVAVDSGAGDAEVAAEADDIVDDGFGPVGDDDDYNADDADGAGVRGLLALFSISTFKSCF